MIFSILITTSGRVNDLKTTLNYLYNTCDLKKVEVLVVSDGCSRTYELSKTDFHWVNWYNLEVKVGASAARNYLYNKAKGKYLIGLDDDAHVISENALENITEIFNEFPNTGIIAFKEYKGLDITVRKGDSSTVERVNDFVGCGFCIKNEIYKQTNGFPLWMDIYGEESCVAIEVLNLGYDILYTNRIAVHHRVDKEARRNAGYSLFRFKKSLLNGNKFYWVYYPTTYLPRALVKIFIHNFFKYAIKSPAYFHGFVSIYIKLIGQLPGLFKYRNPVSSKTIMKSRTLKPMPY